MSNTERISAITRSARQREAERAALYVDLTLETAERRTELAIELLRQPGDAGAREAMRILVQQLSFLERERVIVREKLTGAICQA